MRGGVFITELFYRCQPCPKEHDDIIRSQERVSDHICEERKEGEGYM
jgi:hypothetical protein